MIPEEYLGLTGDLEDSVESAVPVAPVVEAVQEGPVVPVVQEELVVPVELVAHHFPE